MFGAHNLSQTNGKMHIYKQQFIWMVIYTNSFKKIPKTSFFQSSNER